MGDLADIVKGSASKRKDDGGNWLSDALGSAGRFGGNVIGDVKDIGEGLGNILGAAGHDLLWNPLSAPFKDEQQFYTDDLLKAIPGALAEDFAKRYGSVEGFKQGLYEDPLSFAGDIATVLTGGGYAAAKAAKAGKLGSAGEKILPGLKTPGAPLGGVKQVLSGTGGERATVTPVARAFNPAKRALAEPLIDRALSRPISSVERKLDNLIPEDQDSQLIQDTLKLAEQHGLTRIDRPLVAKFKARKLAQRLIGEHGHRHVAERDRRMNAYTEIFQRLDESTVETFHKTAQGLEPIQGQRLSVPDIMARMEDPAVLESPRATKAAETIRPIVETLDTLDPEERIYAERVVEHLGEALTEPADEVASVMDDARLLNFTQEASDLPYKVVFERAYLPMRLQQGARWNRRLKDFEGGPDALQLDDTMRAQGLKAPIYFPHIKKGKVSDYLMPWSLYRMRAKAQSPGSKKNRGKVFVEDLNRQRDNYIKDPTEAYSRRAAQVVKLQETQSFIEEMVTKLGRPIQSLEEVGSAERHINLDGVRQRIHKKLETDEAMEDALSTGAKAEDALIEGLEQAYAPIAEDLAELAATKGQLWAVPEVVAKRIEGVAGSNAGSIATKLMWDKPAELWRNAVLYYRPGFFLNNVYGNVSFLKLQGGKLSRVVRQLDKRYRQAVRDAIGEENLPGVESGFFSKTEQRTTHMGAFAETKPGAMLQSVGQSAPVKAAARVTDGLRRLNQAIENSFRRESFITAKERTIAQTNIRTSGKGFWLSKKRLEHIAKNGADEGIAKRAMDEMNQTMNNYEGLSPLERRVVRRWFAPFWPFYKHAARTLITLPYKHPVKAALLGRMAEIDKEFVGDPGLVPEYLERGFPIGPGNMPGETRFWMSRGANPISSVAENPLSLLHPFMKAPLEHATGRDVFTGKPFSANPEDVYKDFGTGQQYSTETGEPVTVRPSLVEHILRMFPQVETARDLIGGGEQYSGTGEVITDEAGEPKYPTDPIQEVLKYLGLSTTDMDLQQYQQEELARRARARQQP